MGIKIKHTDPTLNEFATNDLVVNVQSGSLFFKSNTKLFKLQGDDQSTTDVIEFSGLSSIIQDTNGNIGIGTTTPGEKLEVVGNISASGDIVGNNLTIGHIEATTINTTQITSSIVTASIIYSSGSNIFGDEISDTQTLNGHITASGNISSSGNVYGTDFFDNSVNINTIYSPIEGGTGILTTGALNAGSITSGFTSIDVGAGAITTTGTVTAGSITLNGNFTFGNGSGRTITGPLNEDLILNARPNGADEGLIIQIGGVNKLSILNGGSATFANHITASGTVKAEHFYSTDDAVFDDDVDIKGDLVVNKGDNRPISIGANAGSITAQGDSGGWANFLKFKGSSGTDHGGFYGFGNADILKRFGIAAVFNDIEGFHIISGSGVNKVGIGTLTPPEQLTVEGNISSSGTITAVSGSFQHISASKIDVDASTIRIGGTPFNKTDLDNLKLGKPLVQDSAVSGFTSILRPQAIMSPNDDSTYQKFTIAGRVGQFVSGTLFFEQNLSGSNNYIAAGITNTQLRLTGNVTASGNISASGNIHAIDYFDNNVNINTIYSPIVGHSNIVTVGTIGSGVWNATKILSPKTTHVLHYPFRGFCTGISSGNFQYSEDFSDPQFPFQLNTDYGNNIIAEGNTTNHQLPFRSSGMVAPRACTAIDMVGWASCAAGEVTISLCKLTPSRNSTDAIVPIVVATTTFTSLGNTKIEDFAVSDSGGGDGAVTIVTAPIAKGDILMPFVLSPNTKTTFFNLTLEVES